jgi:predicted acylesterase/phospholipase RssA
LVVSRASVSRSSSALLRLVLAGVVAFVLAGCASLRPNLPESELTAVPFGAVTLFDGSDRPLANLSEVQRNRHLEILMLSGGGAHGAFGAGVLNGWTASGKRPQFDLVTGVSTGALLAVPAFLGPSYDPLIKRVYTTSQNSDIYLNRGVLSGLFGTSLNDSAPLAAQIAAIVDETVLDDIANEHRKGRRLYIATTNLDAGQLVVWDMGRIAVSNDPQRLTLFRRVLLASASIPGFFDPVYIPVMEDGKGGQMHVDGGVKAPVLLRSWMLDVKAPTKNVYTIVNGRLALTDTSGEVQAKLLTIAGRSISELLRGLLYKTLYQSYVMTKRARGNFWLTYVPDDVTETPATSFDPAAMNSLYEVGYAIGTRGQLSWRKDLPRLELFERL